MSDEWNYEDKGQDVPPPENEAYGPDRGGGDMYETEPMPSWERRDEIGFVAALLATIKEVLLDPGQTFRRMPLSDGLWGPLLFIVIVGSIGAIVSFIYNIMFRVTLMGVMQNAPGFSTEEQLLGIGMIFVFLVLSPVIIGITAFVWAGIYHVCLMLTGGAKQDYETTFRVICYASGATSLLQLIPCAGGLAAIVWFLYSGTIGLQETHQTTTGKALMALLLPLIVCCLCCGIAFTGAVGTGFLANM